MNDLLQRSKLAEQDAINSYNKPYKDEVEDLLKNEVGFLTTVSHARLLADLANAIEARILRKLGK